MFMPEDMTNVEQGIPKVNPVMDKLRQINPIERLRSTLMSEHHPYGLLLMSTPFISAAAGPMAYNIDASGLSSSSLLADSSSDTEPVNQANYLRMSVVLVRWAYLFLAIVPRLR